MLRQPAVAGMFYEQNPEMLRDNLAELWPSPRPETVAAIGAMTPHAGYMYSGRTAAKVYARLNPAEVVILLGPNHTGRGWPMAVSHAEAWATPLGRVPVDRDLTGGLLRECRLVKADDAAHEREHALEVQLPFLQQAFGRFSIVAVALGTDEFAPLQELGLVLAQLIRSDARRCLLLASSDMNHFATLTRTKDLDHKALQQVLSRNPQGLLETVARERISMCGAIAAAVMLVAAAELGADKAELVDYTTSAETSGDAHRVVGYAGVIVR
ncbi:MAG: AmmeMemoRadiSam system protein B [candidate division FCPU426 bacterium]